MYTRIHESIWSLEIMYNTRRDDQLAGPTRFKCSTSCKFGPHKDERDEVTKSSPLIILSSRYGAGSGKEVKPDDSGSDNRSRKRSRLGSAARVLQSPNRETIQGAHRDILVLSLTEGMPSSDINCIMCMPGDLRLSRS